MIPTEPIFGHRVLCRIAWTHLEIRRHFSAVAEGDLDALYGRKSYVGIVGEGELQACVFAAPRPMRASGLRR